MKQKNFHPTGKSRDKSPRSAPKGDGYRKDAPKPSRGRNDGAERPAKDRDDAKPVRDTGREFTRDKKSFGGNSRLSGPILYGFHAVRAALLNPKRRVLRIMGTDSGLDEFQKTMDHARLKGLKVPNAETFDKVAFDRMMPQGAVHQGIAASVESLPVLDADDLLEGLDANAPAIFVILDQVTDPHNVGAIMRSAAAFGARGVILQDKTAPEFTGVLAKAASGAVDALPIAQETNLSRCIEKLQDNGFFVIGLDERGEDIGKLPTYNRVALVLGAEGAGIRRLVAEHCDILASLPTSGEILSLNVSNAAAVALYAVRTKI